MTMVDRTQRISIIVPFFNGGRDVVEALHQELGSAAATFASSPLRKVTMP